MNDKKAVADATSTQPNHSGSHAPRVSRRAFVATGAAVAGAAAVGVNVATLPDAAKAIANEQAPGEETWVRTTCSPNCTGACGMEARVQDGKVRMIRQAATTPSSTTTRAAA